MMWAERTIGVKYNPNTNTTINNKRMNMRVCILRTIDMPACAQFLYRSSAIMHAVGYVQMACANVRIENIVTSVERRFRVIEAGGAGRCGLHLGPVTIAERLSVNNLAAVGIRLPMRVLPPPPPPPPPPSHPAPQQHI